MKEENKVIINGEEYVKASSIRDACMSNKLMDAANVAMVVNVGEQAEHEIIKVFVNASEPLVFKKNCVINECSSKLNGVTWFLPDNLGLYSIEYVKFANQIVSVLGGVSINKKHDFDVFVGYDEELKVFKKEFPVMLVRGKVGVIIAPKIMEDD
jgi:hypothetical protein